MSIRASVGNLTQHERETMARELVVKPKETQYKKNTQAVYPYTISDSGTGSFPYAYMRKKSFKNARVFAKASRYSFDGKLRDEQETVRTECIAHLNATGSCVLSMYPGFGKTAIAIEISQRVNLKTLIVVNRVVLLNQWRESIARFCPLATVSTVYSSTADTDFYIVNAVNVEKMTGLDKFGFVVVDECHMIVTETLSKCLLAVHPKYILGLSATPYRSDGMDMLIDLHFGTNKIVKQLSRKHVVYVVHTGFVPVMKILRNGKPDWNSVMDSQSTSPDRAQIIRRIVAMFADRKFLILCKRIEQAHLIVAAIDEECATLFGDKQVYDKSRRVLVATVQKAGVGFDDSSIDALILASDIQEYFVQYLGRCMRTPHGVPYVFDLVDENKILHRHFAVRKKVYAESGGEFKKLIL
jgi:superfamily II DNA or RNA helicase